MLKILFVDHAMHRGTESSAFFVALLETRFAVSRLDIAPNEPPVIDWRFVAGFDVVVLWQMDFLAPLFLARGHRTVVVPMYDGSAILPQVHWACSAGANFVNFSRTLHERVRLLGLSSLLVKYFPEAVAEESLPEFDGLRVFLWQRRPEDGITADLVGKLFGGQLTSLHVHNAPDNPAMAAAYKPPSSIAGVPVTVSEWFANRADYYRVLEAANVFVCPRTSEGIGMAMVEAMARGLLIVANDLPSHNEYVCNWLNGVLFNTANVGWADFSSVRPVARMGWRTVREGRRRWLASIDGIVDFIAHTPRYRPASPRLIAELQHDLVPAYFAGGEVYERFLLKQLPGLLNREQDSDELPAAPAAGGQRRMIASDRPHFPVVVVPSQTASSAVVAIAFADGAARPLLRGGWSVDEAFGVWIDGLRADLSFAATIAFPVASLRLRLVALLPGDSANHAGLGITINQVSSSRLLAMRGGGPCELQCEVALPAPVNAPSWHLEFCCDRALGAAGDARRLSVAIIALTIEFLPAIVAVQPQEDSRPPLAVTAPAPRQGREVADPRAAAAAALDAVVRKASRREKAGHGAVAQGQGNGTRRPAGARERVELHQKV